MINPEQQDAFEQITDQDASRFFQKAYSLMDWPRVADVLDYGCGSGKRTFAHILPQVKKFQGQLYSMDISQDLVDRAWKTYPNSRVHYATGDIIARFPFKHVKFDNILSFDALHLVEDIRAAFKGFHKCLNYGGHFGFMTLTANSTIIQALGQVAQLDQWKMYMPEYERFMVTWSEYPEGSDEQGKDCHFRSLLNQSGFHVKYLQVRERQHTYIDIDQFLDACLEANPFLDRVPNNCHLMLREDYRKIVTNLVGIPINSKSITISHEQVSAVVQKPRNMASHRKRKWVNGIKHKILRKLGWSVLM